MRASFGNSAQIAREIQGQFRPGIDKSVRPAIYSVCKALWPHSTEAHIAAAVGCSVRNGSRYLSGELECPAVLLIAINIEITQKRG
jgi:hypothetical protein